MSTIFSLSGELAEHLHDEPAPGHGPRGAFPAFGRLGRGRALDGGAYEKAGLGPRLHDPLAFQLHVSLVHCGNAQPELGGHGPQGRNLVAGRQLAGVQKGQNALFHQLVAEQFARLDALSHPPESARLALRRLFGHVRLRPSVCPDCYVCFLKKLYLFR